MIEKMWKYSLVDFLIWSGEPRAALPLLLQKRCCHNHVSNKP